MDVINKNNVGALISPQLQVKYGSGDINSIIVRYFPRVEGYWEGHEFPMLKLKLLYEAIRNRPTVPDIGITIEPGGTGSEAQSDICVPKLVFRTPTDTGALESVDNNSDGAALNPGPPLAASSTLSLGVHCSSFRPSASLLSQLPSDLHGIFSAIECTHTVEYLERIRWAYVNHDPDLASYEFESKCDLGVVIGECRDVLGTLRACEDAVRMGRRRVCEDDDISSPNERSPSLGTNKSSFGFGFNIGGGNHHSMPNRGEGFCIFNDVAVALNIMMFLRDKDTLQTLTREENDNRESMGATNSDQTQAAITTSQSRDANTTTQSSGLDPITIDSALVIDLDVHQGNGTNAFFGPERRAFLAGERGRYGWYNENSQKEWEEWKTETGTNMDCGSVNGTNTTGNSDRDSNTNTNTNGTKTNDINISTNGNGTTQHGDNAMSDDCNSMNTEVTASPPWESAMLHDINALDNNVSGLRGDGTNKFNNMAPSDGVNVHPGESQHVHGNLMEAEQVQKLGLHIGKFSRDFFEKKISAKIFTANMHSGSNFPHPKTPSDIDIELRDNCEDTEYLQQLDVMLQKIDLLLEGRNTNSEGRDSGGRDSEGRDNRSEGNDSEDENTSTIGAQKDTSDGTRTLKSNLKRTLCNRPPIDLCIYVAGADPYEKDRLGGLKITKSGLRKRDEKVIHWCRARGIPVAVVLAGGYAEDVADIADIHWNTFDVGRRACFTQV